MLFKTISLPVVFCVLLAVCCSKQPSESEGNTTIENKSDYTVECTYNTDQLYTFSLNSGAKKTIDLSSVTSSTLKVKFPDNTVFTRIITNYQYYTITNSGIN